MTQEHLNEARQWLRELRNTGWRNATHIDTIETALKDAEADKARLDWLSDKDNPIGNVHLPSVCVMNNLHSLRGAIDEAMRLDPEIVKTILEATEEGA